MSKSHFFSVIIPIYNTEKYIEQCVNSIYSQSFDNFEVLLINDGSTDDSDTVCKKLASRYKNIFYLKQVNQGLSAARNLGISNASGEYILFLDSDDQYFPGALKRLSLVIENQLKPDVIEFRLARINEKTQQRVDSRIFNETNFQTILSCQSDSSACNKAIKLSLIKSVNFSFPYGKIYEDVSSIYELYFFAKTLYTTSDILYLYNVRENSITQNFTKNNIEALFEAADSANRFLNENAVAESFEQELIIRFINLTIHALNEIEERNLDKMIQFTINQLHSRVSLKKCFMALKIQKDNILLKYFFDKVVIHSQIKNIKQLKKKYLTPAEIKATNNVDLSIKINQIIQFLTNLSNRYSRVAIYGYGALGKLALSILDTDKVICFDQNTSESRAEPIANLSAEKFDIVFISVLGRESEISEYLVQSCNVPPEKILTFQ